jgi:hypothetical protein
MATPIADPARCDVPGCGKYATYCTEGDEEDGQGLGRPALARLNVCDHHANWPHSEDAKAFALSPLYQQRR